MRNNILTFFRILAGSIFTVSGYQKLLEGPVEFAAIIRDYQIIGGEAVNWAALVLPWCEFILGVFLVLGLWRKLSILALWFLNAVFIAALLSAKARGISLKNCGCFGEASGFSFTPDQALVFDVLLWFLFVILWRFKSSGHALDNIFDKRSL